MVGSSSAGASARRMAALRPAASPFAPEEQEVMRILPERSIACGRRTREEECAQPAAVALGQFQNDLLLIRFQLLQEVMNLFTHVEPALDPPLAVFHQHCPYGLAVIVRFEQYAHDLALTLFTCRIRAVLQAPFLQSLTCPLQRLMP